MDDTDHVHKTNNTANTNERIKTIDDFLKLLPKDNWYLQGRFSQIRHESDNYCPLVLAAQIKYNYQLSIDNINMAEAASYINIDATVAQRIVSAADNADYYGRPGFNSNFSEDRKKLLMYFNLLGTTDQQS